VGPSAIHHAICEAPSLVFLSVSRFLPADNNRSPLRLHWPVCTGNIRRTHAPIMLFRSRTGGGRDVLEFRRHDTEINECPALQQNRPYKPPVRMARWLAHVDRVPLFTVESPGGWLMSRTGLHNCRYQLFRATNGICPRNCDQIQVSGHRPMNRQGIAVFAGYKVDKWLKIPLPLLVWLLPLVVLIGIIYKLIKETSGK